MRLLDRPGARLGISTFILFVGWASDSVRNAIGWWGFGVVVLFMVLGSSLLLIRSRRRLTLNRIPLPLIALLGLAVLSIAWSYYRLSSVLGVSLTILTVACGVAVALSLSWPELLRVLGWVFRAILGLSYLFELFVAIVIRHPVFPIWVAAEDRVHPAKLLYWSRDLLFDGGKIQGIVGNSSLLAMVSLIALIVFTIQLLSRTVTRVGGVFWVLVAAGTVALTRSATIIIGLAVVLLVTAAVLIVRRAGGGRRGIIARVGILVVLAAGAVLAVIFRTPLLGLLGKSADFTGRIGIWDAVIGLAQQRPAFGWGWISYWVPWAPPFDHLIVRGGVQVLHAHNAWLDVWLQLGILGLVVFGALVLSTLVRSWQHAVDRELVTRSGGGLLTARSLLPLLVLCAQLVQSLAESRILIEGGMMLLVIWAVKTKAHDEPVPEASATLKP